ncbi:MAG: acyl-CoA dehydrogenase family protein [Brevundimonas sp.]|nr:acyl-CoA dehydrogenase family protein [Brevundimonas sp.]
MTPDQEESLRLVRDSAGGIAPRTGDFKRIRELRSSQAGFDRKMWTQMADLGWLSARLPEAEGGLGLGMAGFCAIAAELGQALAPEPFCSAAAVVGLLPADLRERALTGELLVIPAWQETPGGPHIGTGVRLVDGKVSGRKILVSDAAGADAFLASTDAGLAFVDAGADGVHIDSRVRQDGGHFSVVTFDEAPATPIEGRLEEALEDMTLATSAYLLGAAERAFAMTLDYLSIRKQFGRLIGSFQVLQHRCVDMKIQIELGRAVLNEAIAVTDEGGSARERRVTVSRAKARISDLALLVSRESIQMHGAIGVTEEHDIGLFCRKALALYNQYGTARWHRARYLELSRTKVEA